MATKQEKEPEGRLVKSGTPPPHTCLGVLPKISSYWEGAVWLCGCGKFYKKKLVAYDDLSDYGGFSDWDWVEVKDAEGNEWRRIEIPKSEYVGRRFLWMFKCKRCDFWVNCSHRHTRKV